MKPPSPLPPVPATSPPRPPWHAYAALAASMSIVGGYVGLSKLLVAVFPVFLLAWLRFAIAALAMAGWARRGAGEPPLAPAERRLLFWQSFFGNFLFSLCMLAGVALTSALAAGVILSAIPAAVALLSRALLGERIAARAAAGIALAVAGIALLALARADQAGAPAAAATAAASVADSTAASAATGRAAGSGAGATASVPAASPAGKAPARLPLLGEALLVGAVWCEAAYVVLGRRLAASVPPRRVSALINLWGLALVTPLGAWAAWGFDFGAVRAGTWLLLTAYALAASVLTVWLWMAGIRHVPAAQAGVFTVMLPISAAAVGVLALGEPVGPMHAAALGLAVAGVALASRAGRR